MIRSVLENAYVVFALRLLIGMTFLFASIDKIADPQSFGRAVANYDIIFGPTVLVVATVLPWVELLCGLAVLTGLYMRGGSFILLLLLTTFTLAVLSGLIRGLDISCGCFTLDPDVNRIGWKKVFENIGLLLANFVIFSSHGRRFTMRTP